MKLEAKFNALASQTRIDVVSFLLKGEMSVSEIAKKVDKSQPNISIALEKLLNSGIILKERKGKFIFYRLKDTDKTKKIIEMVGKL